MPCNLYMTFRGEIRGERYKSLDDLMVAYKSVPDRYQPAWAYDEAGALILGAEPKGFERPTLQTSGGADRPTVAITADNANNEIEGMATKAAFE
jgi:hypothetical protein